MKKYLRNLLLRELSSIIEKIKNDSCIISEEEAIELLDTITHIGISRDDAMKELNVSKSTFYLQTANGIIPKGRKRKGFNELVWFRDEIRKCIERLKR